MRHAAHPRHGASPVPHQLPLGHDGAEAYAKVEDAAHLALGDVAEGSDQGEHRRLFPR